jgi:hypothetical protein
MLCRTKVELAKKYLPIEDQGFDEQGFDEQGFASG